MGLNLEISYEDLLFSLPFPSAILDPEGKIVNANQKFEDLLKTSLKFLKGREISEVFRCKNLSGAVKRTYAENIEVHGLRCKDFSVYLSPLFDSAIKRGVLFVARPVETSPFEEDISLFLKGLSHEIKNPLSGIKGAAKLILKLGSCDEELLQVIISEVNRIEKLLKNILSSFDFSNLTVKRVNINRVVGETFSPFQHLCREEGIKYFLLFDPSLPEVPLDVDKFKQALFNVIKNGIEALKKSRRKEIKIETGYSIRPSDFVFVKISDTGCGMDEETLKRYGMPFFTTKEKGTGLGTFIAREIVKGHGGELLVESSPGKGTTVTLLIPMKRKSWQEFS